MIPVSTYGSDTDERLACEIRHGNQLAFAVIYDRYHKAMLQVAFHYLKGMDFAEDAVQDVFVNFWMHRERLDENQSIKGLLFTSLKNHTLNVLRKQKKDILDRYEELLNLQVTENQEPLTDELPVLTDLIEKAVELLSPQRKLIFYLKNTEKLTNEEIGKKLDISVNTVKVQYYHILKEIRKYASEHMASSLLLISALFH